MATLDSSLQNLSSSGDSVSFSFTNTSGDLLVVGFAIRASGTAASNVTYGGQALTRADRQTHADEGSSEIWYLVNPPTGANTFAYDRDTSGGGSRNDDVRAMLATFVTGGYIFDKAAKGTSSAGAGSVTITPSAGPALLVGVLSSEGGADPGAGTGETDIFSNDEGTWSTAFEYAEDTTGPTAHTVNWNTNDDYWAAVVAAFSPVRSTTFATSVTSMPVNLPPSIASGDLLLAFVEVRNAGTWTPPTGWTEFAAQVGGGSVGELTAFYKIADGTEGASATWTAGTSTTAAWQVRKIAAADWEGSTAPEAATASGDASSADPPNLSPSWGTTEIWVAVAGHTAASTTAFSAAPTNYSNFQNTGGGSGGAAVSLASAKRTNSASSENPGTFTVSGSNRWWAAMTVAVRPVSTGTQTSDTRNARIKGQVTSTDNRNARTKGKATVTDTRNARVLATEQTSDVRNARTKGVATTSDSRGARLYAPGSANDTRDARIKGQVTTTDNRGAKTKGKYPASGTAQSDVVDIGTGTITKAIIWAEHTLNGGTVTYYLSADNGNNWEEVTHNTDHTFTNPGSNLKFRAVLTPNGDGTATPVITYLTISYNDTPGIEVSDTRNARIKGKVTTSDTRNARTKGKTTTSDTRDARTYGKATTSDTRGARTYGKQTTTDTRNARLKGQITTSNTRNARIVSKDTTSDTRGARIVSKDTTSNTRNARIIGQITISDSRGARTVSKDTTSATRNAKIHGKATTSDSRGGRIKGKATTTDTRNAKAKGKATDSDTRNARTYGKQTTTDTRSARVKGKDTTSNSRPARTIGSITTSDTRNARIVSKDTISDTRGAHLRSLLTAEDTRNAKVKGVDTTSDTRNARLLGQITTSDTRNAKTKGKQTTTDTRSARTYGKATTSATRSARTWGKQTTTDTRNAKAKGKDTASATRSARTWGSLTTSDTRGAKVKSKDTVTNSRGAKTKGKLEASDTRGAKITGQNIRSDSRGARIIAKAWNNKDADGWYTNNPVTYKTKNTGDWYEDNPQTFKTKNTTDWKRKY